MSVVNAGRVELDVVAIARDQVTATMREVNRSLEATKRKADEAAGASRTFGQSITAFSKDVKEGIKPLNAAREGIENLRANFVAFPLVIGGAIAGLVAFYDKLVMSGTGIQWWADNSKEVAKAADSIVAATERLREYVSPETNPIAKLFGPARERELTKMREGVGQLERKIGELRKAGDIGEALGLNRGEFEDTLGALFGLVDKVGGRQEEIKGTQAQITDLARQEKEYREASAAALEDQAREARKAAQAEFDALAAKVVDKGTGGAITPAEIFASFQNPITPRLPTPGPRRQRENEMAFLLAEDFENRERVRKEREASEEKLREAEAAIDEIRAARRGPSTRELRLQHLEAEKQRVDELAESYRRFADGVRDAFESAVPGLGGAVDRLAEVAVQMGAVDDANKRAALGAGGTISAIMDVAAANAETAQEAFVYKGAGEVAAGLGSLAIGDGKGAALHFASAAAYGVAATMAGGSGGGGGRGGASAGSSSQGGPSALDRGGNGGGPTTVIYQVDVKPGTDPQSVVRGLRQTELSARNTGRANPGV